VGLRNLADQPAKAKGGKAARAALPSFKQYREADGKFHFKLVDARGRLLLQSRGFDSARDAGVTIAKLRESASTGIDLAAIGEPGEGVAQAEIVSALALLAEPG
jgi:tryptophanyl-tRNA synthetase